jgi:RNA polymerase sigma factor (sigma-70 family)
VKWRPLAELERDVAPPVPASAIGSEAGGFDTIVVPHFDAAYNLARWLVRDRYLADDVVQDAMLRALRYFISFKGGDARAWLLRIVRNAAYAALAARQGGGIASLDACCPAGGEGLAARIADPADDPEAALLRNEGRADLDRALAALPAELRECLILHELEELPYKAVANITGVPVGTVMSRLWRARQALMRTHLQEATP